MILHYNHLYKKGKTKKQRLSYFIEMANVANEIANIENNFFGNIF